MAHPEAHSIATRGLIDDPRITTVRVMYSDLHGVARGKDVPLAEFPRIGEHGLCFCAAVMSTDLQHTPVLGGEVG
jgi:glutamine synthetase